MSITRIIEQLNLEATDTASGPLIDAALDAVIAMDGIGRVIAWNKAAEDIFGWRRDEALGLQLSQMIIPEKYREAHHAGLARYRQTGAGPVINARVEVSARRRDGSEFPAELTIVPIGARGSEVFYAFLRDITDRTLAERLTKQRMLEAQVLYEATSLIPRGGSADEIFAHCLRKICELTGWSVGHVLRPSPPTAAERLVPTDIWHFSVEGFEGIVEPTQEHSFALGEGVPGHVWASGEPAWIEDIEVTAGFLRRDLYLGHGLRAVFAFPVYQEGRLAAVLEFFSPLAQKPDEVLILVARSLAVQLGPVLERQRAVEHREMLLRELDHRVINLFAVVKAVFNRTAAHAGSMDDLIEKFEGRLEGLLRAHQVLRRGGGTSASLRDVIASSVEPFCGTTTSASLLLEGPDISLKSRSATDLSLVFHELATNAAKHGSLSTPGGKLLITWRLVQAEHSSQVVLDWRETHGPPIIATGRRGYGSVLIERLVTRSLGGTWEHELDECGFKGALRFPVAAPDAPFSPEGE